MKTKFDLKLKIRVSNESNGKDRYTVEEVSTSILNGTAEFYRNANDTIFILDTKNNDRIMGVVEEHEIKKLND